MLTVGTKAVHEAPRTLKSGDNNAESFMARKIQQHAFGGPEVLHLAHVEVPAAEDLGAGEVLVRTTAAGVNPIDAQTRSGGGVSGLWGDFPITVGWDVAGTIEAIGPGTTLPHRVGVGSRVTAFARFPEQAGAYAEYVIVPAAELAPVPEPVPDSAAGALPLAGLTAWQALSDVAGVTRGQRVLVQGVGGVGHLAVQIARHLGAYVLATAGAGKRGWVAGLGADQVIDYTSEDLVAALRDDPVDVVLNTVGARVGPQSVAVTRPGGLIVEIPGSDVSNATKTAAQHAGVRTAYHAVHPDGSELARLLDLAGSGALTVHVDAEYTLEDAAKAHHALETGHGSGKIVLRP